MVMPLMVTLAAASIRGRAWPDRRRSSPYPALGPVMVTLPIAPAKLIVASGVITYVEAVNTVGSNVITHRRLVLAKMTARAQAQEGVGRGVVIGGVDHHATDDNNRRSSSVSIGPQRRRRKDMEVSSPVSCEVTRGNFSRGSSPSKENRSAQINECLRRIA
jgi:hypothetical protein